MIDRCYTDSCWYPSLRPGSSLVNEQVCQNSIMEVLEALYGSNKIYVQKEVFIPKNVDAAQLLGTGR